MAMSDAWCHFAHVRPEVCVQVKSTTVASKRGLVASVSDLKSKRPADRGYNSAVGNRLASQLLLNCRPNNIAKLSDAHGSNRAPADAEQKAGVLRRR